jgi:lipoyl(octanoyl) transferase
MTVRVSTAPARPDCAPEWLASGTLVPYPEAVATMQAHIAAIRAGTGRDRIWLLEHPPLYTAGTSARQADLAEPDRLPIFATGRGGQWTYHGPGQLVAYVMLDLTRPHGQVPPRDTHAYVAALEAWLIATLARCGVQGERRAGRVGVWVRDARSGADNKVAALGVRITRWVSWHGIALNVCPELDHFSGIVPCGIREHGVTSLRALGKDTTMAEARDALQACWGDVFGSKEESVLF